VGTHPAGTPPDAGSTEASPPVAKRLSNDSASSRVEQAVSELARLKQNIKDLESMEEELSSMIQSYMKDAAELLSYDGRVLATWKTAKSSKRFSADTFKQAMPDIYEQFVIEQPGSRRFLVRGVNHVYRTRNA